MKVNKSYAAKALLAGTCLGVMAFVFMNTYEVVFNKDIILANAVTKYGPQAEIKAVINQFNIKPEAAQQASNAAYGKLEMLEFPALSSHLSLEEKRVIDGLWYVRPNLGQYVGLNRDAYGVTLDYLIYTRSSWRTFPAPSQLEVGMEAKVYHDGHDVATYKIVEKQAMPLEGTFIASKTRQRQIILLIEDHKDNAYYGFSLVGTE